MFDTYVASQLVLWAEHRIRKASGALGYPRKSNFAKDYGTGFWSPEMESDAYFMDKCVVALRPALQDVIMREYTETGTQEQKARRCGCCLRTYTNRISTAHREILGFMNDLATGVALPAYKKLDVKIAEFA